MPGGWDSQDSCLAPVRRWWLSVMALPLSFSPWDPHGGTGPFQNVTKGKCKKGMKWPPLQLLVPGGNVSLVLTSRWPKSVMGPSVTPGLVFLPQGGTARCTEAFQGEGSEWLGTMITSTL